MANKNQMRKRKAKAMEIGMARQARRQLEKMEKERKAREATTPNQMEKSWM